MDLKRLHLIVAVAGVCMASALVTLVVAALIKDTHPGDIGFFLVAVAGLCAQAVAVAPLGPLIASRSGRAVRGVLIALGALVGLAALMFMPFFGITGILTGALLFGSVRLARFFPRVWLAAAIPCVLVGLVPLGIFGGTLAR